MKKHKSSEMDEEVDLILRVENSCGMKVYGSGYVGMNEDNNKVYCITIICEYNTNNMCVWCYNVQCEFCFKAWQNSMCVIKNKVLHFFCNILLVYRSRLWQARVIIM